MPTSANDAAMVQRDTSRKLYFVAAGCLYHPHAHLVTDADPGQRAALERALESALKFAQLSEDEQAAFRERAVAETRVVKTAKGTYAFEQPDRPARRKHFDVGGAGTMVSQQRVVVGLAAVAALVIWPVLILLLC